MYASKHEHPKCPTAGQCKSPAPHLTLSFVSPKRHAGPRRAAPSWVHTHPLDTSSPSLVLALPAPAQGPSRWSSGKECTWQCRRCRRLRFNPWVRKIPWRRKWPPTPVFLPGKSHEQRSLTGCTPRGRKGAGHN